MFAALTNQRTLEASEAVAQTVLPLVTLGHAWAEEAAQHQVQLHRTVAGQPDK